jgi:hypothetical protein
MSNLAVINFSIGGTLSISGKTTLAETILSSSTASFQGLSTTSLNSTGTSTFTSLPTSTQTPTLDSQLTTKVYVDTADGVLNKRITDNDTSVRTYIDASYNELNNIVSGNDTSVRTYIDASYNELNTRVTDTDSTQKKYIDQEVASVFTRENTWSEIQLFSKLPYVGINLTPSRGQDLTLKSYVDTSIRTTQEKPVFYVFLSPSQTIANNTLSRVFFRNKVFNLFDKYDIINDFFFKPSLVYSGYYNLSTTISFPNITSGYIAIYKNGEEYSRSNAVSSASPVALSLSVSTIMYFNRDTDVADVRLFCTPSNILVAGQSNSFFTGSFIQNLFGSES